MWVTSDDDKNVGDVWLEMQHCQHRDVTNITGIILINPSIVKLDLPHGVSSIEHKDCILVRLRIQVLMNLFLYLFHLLFSPILFVLHRPIWIFSITMWFEFCNLGKFWLSFHVWDFVQRDTSIPHWDEFVRNMLRRLNFLDCSDRTCLANGEILMNIEDIPLQHLDSKSNLNKEH